MNRLTEKRKEPLTTKWKDVPTSYYKINGDDTGVAISEIGRLNKLGKLEDLEEELGCPLEVIGKALKSGVYHILGSGKMYLERCLKLNYYSGIEEWSLIKKGLSFNLKDYKKTWWLKGDKSE